MKNRRHFLQVTGLGFLGILSSGLQNTLLASTAKSAIPLNKDVLFPQEKPNPKPDPNPTNPISTPPVVISTWNHGLAANQAAWTVLAAGGKALDAVEKGVMVTESDPDSRSVGLGGLPDRTGKVTLDACIMDEKSRCGSVSFLQHIENPIAVARLVMEKTPHVMLSGKGALQFALQNGFKKTNLLTKPSKADWKKWMKAQSDRPRVNSENHDTIGMLALDHEGNLSAACTTSGMAWKLHGRVGDSPIIGAGLFLDNEVGAACATGVGEAVIRVAGSAMVVELMRQGKSPQAACEEVVMRIIRKHEQIGGVEGLQVGFLALDREGHYGAYSVYAGFNFALHDAKREEMVDAGFNRKWD